MNGINKSREKGATHNSSVGGKVELQIMGGPFVAPPPRQIMGGPFVAPSEDVPNLRFTYERWGNKKCFNPEYDRFRPDVGDGRNDKSDN